MPIDLFADEAKRQAQIGQLRGPAPIAGAPPPGWDAGNWADPNMHSVKYDAGRLLYGKTRPSEVAAAVSGADFQKRFPGATFNGKDWIDFQGILSDGDHGEPVFGIDYLKGANPETDTSDGPWWGAPDAVGGGRAPTSHKMTINPATDNTALTRIIQELSATANGDQSPAEREAILQLLQGI